MCAAAAQPRSALTPMIPPLSFVGADVTRVVGGSGDRGGGGRDGLDRQFDPYVLADEEPAGFERHIPSEPEVLAIDVGRRAEADALVTHWRGAAAIEVDLQRDWPGRVAHGQVANQLPGVVPQRPHRRRRERDRGVLVDVEEVSALEVSITIVVAAVQAGHTDLHFDVRLLRLL